MVQNYCVMKILLLALVLCSTNGFNLSPTPNYRFREPDLNFFIAKTRSSYFGYTINLRGSSVFVGAPRAQSTLESQRRINETGAIYKCTIATGDCKPFIFDNTGNIIDTGETLTYDSEEKDYQWLGASMDGGPKDTDKLIVCAPRLIANTSVDYLMNGICYWTTNTSSDKPLRVKEIAPLRLKTDQYKKKDGENHMVYMVAQQGLSVHITSENEEIIIGTPGFYVWRGTVIRHFLKPGVLDQTQKIQFHTEIPRLWPQASDSYFGYAVGSGYFDSNLKNKTYYVASAPRARKRGSEEAQVYIFDIIKSTNGNFNTIGKLFPPVTGSQFGEYFGYAVLAEDLNADGLTDLIVTAPQYTSHGHIEQGAIYVFINKKKEFGFEKPKIIISPVKGKGRFGTSISSLGDINRDGYNDVAVGAPFAGYGTVFIYLGSSKGLRERHSQELNAAPHAASWGPSPKFGYGLSKGCDIDNNGFNDFAIGAPNEELVFVYRAYPVVKIVATINSTKQIKRHQKTIDFQICYRISTESQNITSQNISLRVNLDPTYKRVQLQDNHFNEKIFNYTAVRTDKCFWLKGNARYNESYIFKPIELEVHYDLINRIPDSEEFCDKCALVDPNDAKFVVETINYVTGCKSDECIADLKITSSGVNSTFTIGSSTTMSVTYEVTNSGESAYLPTITVTSSKKLPFSKIPTSCNYHKDDSLLCDLNQGNPMLNDKQNITITYDVSQIEGSSITLTATVNSTGAELNTSDNKVSDVIALQELTEIVAIGTTSSTQIDLNKVFKSTEIINNYEIKSGGPSKIQELEIIFEIPIAHKFNGSTQLVSLIDSKNVSVQGVYNSQQLLSELYLNNKLLQINLVENEIETIDMENENQNISETSNTKSVELGYDSEDLESIDDLPRSSTKQVKTNNDHITAIQNKSHELLSEEQTGSLPINRTIYFSCDQPETTCVRAVIKINNFLRDTSINITHKYNIDLIEINKILIEPWENFVIITKLEIVKAGNSNKNTTSIETYIENNVIFIKHFKSEVPWIIIILAVLGGLIVLTAIIYGMHKVGFFKRKSKEDMQRLVQEQQDAAEWKKEMEKLVLEQQNVKNTDDE